MILLLTPWTRGNDFAALLEARVGEPVKTLRSFGEARLAMRQAEYSAIVADQFYLESVPSGPETLLNECGPAIPIFVNFGTTGAERLARETVAALRRAHTMKQRLMQSAVMTLASDVSAPLTGLLLNLESALARPELKPEVLDLLRSVRESAHSIAERIEAVARKNSGGRGNHRNPK